MATKTKNRIAVEVIRSTAKAHLIKDSQGREGWIQARWLDANGTVSESTFESAVESAAERKADFAAKSEAEAAERNFRNADHAVKVARETERAVAAEIVVEFAGCGSTKLVWFPKSIIGGGEGVALIPGWLIREKTAEALEGPQGSDYYSRHRFAKGERARLVRGVEILEAADVAE